MALFSKAIMTTTNETVALSDSDISKISNNATVKINNTDILNITNYTYLTTLSSDSFTVEKFQNNTKDDLFVNIGDIVTYKITIYNNASESLDFYFEDILNSSLEYVADSFIVNGVNVTPTINGQTLSYLIESVAPSGGYAYVEFKTKIL